MTSPVNRPQYDPPQARARRKGWRVEPGVYVSDSDPHAFSEPCTCARHAYGLCPCICHGTEGQIARVLEELNDHREPDTHSPNLGGTHAQR